MILFIPSEEAMEPSTSFPISIPVAVGDHVRTKKGAAYNGIVVTVFESLDGTAHVVVEAVAFGFERSLHVYPMAQIVSIRID